MNCTQSTPDTPGDKRSGAKIVLHKMDFSKHLHLLSSKDTADGITLEEKADVDCLQSSSVSSKLQQSQGCNSENDEDNLISKHKDKDETSTTSSLIEENDSDKTETGSRLDGGEETESDQYDDLFVGSGEDNVSPESRGEDNVSHGSKVREADETNKKQGMFLETFTDLNELEDHLRMNGKNITKCVHCHAEFDLKSGVIEHMKNVHSSKDILSCGLCAAIFDSHADLAVHSKQIHAFDGYRCGICGKFYQIQCDLEKHEEEHAKDSDIKVFKCIYCTDSFSNSNNLFQHSKDVHNVCKFMCGICRLFFQNDRDFLHHRATHSAKECSQFPVLVEHEQEKPAELAKKISKKKEAELAKQKAQDFNQFVAMQMIYSQIRQHDLKVNDPDYGKPLICAICEERFTKNATLAAHSKFAHALVGFDCKECQTFFQIESEAVEHMALHGEVTQIKSEPIEDVKAQTFFGEDGNGNVASQESCHQTVASQGGSSQSMNNTAVDTIEFTAQQSSESAYVAMQSPVESMIFENIESKAGSSNKTEVKNEVMATQSPNDQQTDSSKEKIFDNQHEQPFSVDSIWSNENDLEDDHLVKNFEMTEIKVKIGSSSGGIDPDLKEEGQCKTIDDASESERPKKKNKTSNQKQSSCKACQYCGKIFKNRSAKETHEIKEHTHKYFICEICNKKLSSTLTFNVHMKAHNQAPVMHSCEFCGKSFPYKTSLMTHKISVHTSAKPHVCSFCGMAFKLAKALIKHEKGHNGVGFSCSTCGENFKGDSARRIHQQDVHTGKPKKCKTCGRLFRSLSALRDHELTHTGERPHKCPMCDERFRRIHHVTQHLKRHYKGTA